jgi:hypothetical protein
VLKDEFGKVSTTVAAPKELCDPVQKEIEQPGLPPVISPVTHPEAHLVCFKITQTTTAAKQLWTQNQFGAAPLSVTAPGPLCLPSFNQLVNPGA